MALRNPYTVGGPVRGTNFYGRSALIRSVLEGNDRAIWLIGNRRIGKTSLLCRLEELGNNADHVAFHISLEGADTMEDFAQNFLDDIDDGDTRLERLGLTIADLQGKWPHVMMRLLDRRARERGIEVLLLFDEAEALIHIAEHDGDDVLRDIRREMQRSEALRIVLAATKRLTALNDRARSWDTSPFLYGITPRYLGRLEAHETRALIRQSQSANPLQVDDAVVEAILEATEGHPFLTQWLCDRLWTEDALHTPNDDDLIPDSNLINLFQLDYNYLAPTEQRILRCLAYVQSLDEAGIRDQLGVWIAEVQLRYLVQALVQMCYILRSGDRYSTGNRLLHNWLQFWAIDEQQSRVSDAAAVNHADSEQQNLIALRETHKRRLQVLELQAAQAGANVEARIPLEVADIKQQIAQLDEKLARLRTRSA